MRATNFAKVKVGAAKWLSDATPIGVNYRSLRVVTQIGWGEFNQMARSCVVNTHLHLSLIE